MTVTKTRPTVHFDRVAPTAGERPLAEDAVVAWFRGSSGERYEVRAAEVSCYPDVAPTRWPAAARAALVETLCRPVEAAPLSARFPNALDLRGRFSSASGQAGVRVEGPGTVADAVEVWRQLQHRFRGRRGLAALAAVLGVDPERIESMTGDDATVPPLSTRLATRHALDRYGTALEAVFGFASRILRRAVIERGADLHVSMGRSWVWLAADRCGNLVRAEGRRSSLRIVLVDTKAHEGGTDPLYETWCTMLQAPAARGRVRHCSLSGEPLRTRWDALLATVLCCQTSSSIGALLFIAGRIGDAASAHFHLRALPRALVDEAAESGGIERWRTHFARWHRCWSDLDEYAADTVERAAVVALDEMDRVFLRRRGARALGFDVPGSEPTIGWLADHRRLFGRLSMQRPQRPAPWSAWAFVPPRRPGRPSAPPWTRSVVKTAWGQGSETQRRFATALVERDPDARRLYERSGRAAARWHAALRAAGDEVWARVLQQLRAEIPSHPYDEIARKVRLEVNTNRQVRVVSDDPELLRSVERVHGVVVRRTIAREMGSVDIRFE
jgi:hypothetical protein